MVTHDARRGNATSRRLSQGAQRKVSTVDERGEAGDVTRGRLAVIVAAAAALVLVGGGGVAGVCKFSSVDCHLRGSPPRTDPLAVTAGVAALPDGFTSVTVAKGLALPTAFDFLPDGGILVAEKAGLVRVVRGGRILPRPALDIRRVVNDQWFRGLVAVAVDPDFSTNHFVYAAYSVRRPGVPKTAPSYVRVSRFVLEDDVLRQEKVILGADADPKDGCTRLPPSSDCLPSVGDHIGTGIAFARDGTLFVGTGEGGGQERVEPIAFNAQDPDSIGGKILHITRDGTGVAGNPFFTGNPDDNRSKVWALGVRNPFRIAIAPGTDTPVVGEVGWITTDEIDVATAGVNLGWPCYEGDDKTGRYRDSARCQALYGRGVDVTGPVIAIPHVGATSVTGGTFYVGDRYPEEYRAYYYADWADSTIYRANLDPGSGEVEGKPSSFATNTGGPTAIREGPDGLLYVLALNYGALSKLAYSG
jgi:glucose/arabinose dehydrogenase